MHTTGYDDYYQQLKPIYPVSLLLLYVIPLSHHLHTVIIHDHDHPPAVSQCVQGTLDILVSQDSLHDLLILLSISTIRQRNGLFLASGQVSLKHKRIVLLLE